MPVNDVSPDIIPVSQIQSESPDIIPVDQATPDDPQQRELIQQQAMLNRIKTYDAQQAKYGGISNKLKAGALGIGRGATLGASDVIANELGLTTPEELKGLSEANPVSTGVGQLVGGAGLIAATGGAGAATEGMGLGARLAGSAVEGGVFGAGNAVSDYAMGDPNLNAQKIAAHIGTGALFGAGLGALGETVSASLPKATEALSNATKKIQDLALGTKEGVTPGLQASTDSASSWSDKFNLGLKYGIEGKKIKSRELGSTLQNLDSASGKAAKALYEDALPTNLGESLKDVPLTTAQNTAFNTLNSMKEQLNGIGDITTEPTTPLSSPASIKIVNSAIDSLENSITKAKSSLEIQNALSNFAKDIDSKKIIKFDTMPTASQMADQDVLMGIRNTVRGDLKNPDLWGTAATHYSEASDTYSAFKNSQKNFRKSFMVKQTGSSGRPVYVISPSKVDSLFNKFDDVGQDLKKQHLNEFIEQTNSMAKASENYHGFKQGEKSISDYVESLAKKNEDLQQVAQVMNSKNEGSTLGRNSITAIGAHTLGIPDPITGSALLASKVYQSISNPYQLGSNLGNTFSKLKTIGEILQKSTKSIDSGAKSIFSSNTSRNISSGLVGLSEKQYNKHSERIQELSDKPDELMKHLDNTTKALYEAAPAISTGLHSTITNGILFLKTKLPRPLNELPLNSIWKPSHSQKAKFNKYFGAVNDPVGVLNQVKDGSLSTEAMEALQAVHPELLQQMQQTVMENMVSKKLPSLNYATKIALSKFLGQPLDSGMLPQVIASNQASFMLPSSQEQSTKPSGKSTLGGLKQLTTGTRDFTRTQDLEQDLKKS